VATFEWSVVIYVLCRLSHPTVESMIPKVPLLHSLTEALDAEDARVLYLTFDDGPDAHVTPAILRALHAVRVPASFFVVGERVLGRGAELVLEAVADGHTIGNHSYSHHDLTQLSVTEARRELALTANVLALLGIHVKYVRPPFGRINATIYEIVEGLGEKVALWNNDPRDWSKNAKPDGWVKNTLRGVADNKRVILLHDTHDTTAEHLPGLLNELLARGYIFATMADTETEPHSIQPQFRGSMPNP
jgi:peptidoglycan-N-acetylglucosamine deacetylase